MNGALVTAFTLAFLVGFDIPGFAWGKIEQGRYVRKGRARTLLLEKVKPALLQACPKGLGIVPGGSSDALDVPTHFPDNK